ncbi:MAG: tRNA adenosine(34) deaminase TadA [Candidatus Eremiobacteraeota bacterium]|nr:tRNA adenosine(34) deaminase TadA [Candidatus Eremiobacteraeota bacterium]MCW5869046.1 tRNA adenosine(34) deaminase TadA [Candidatus Eremiobacteraeota bacterium]
MSLALEVARQDQGEVPVGAVVVREEQLLAQAGNQREQSNDPTAHAEVVALREAALRLGRWNLSDCTVYVTLEPCPMCMGAILSARIPRLVYGCHNLKLGAAGSILGLHDFPGLSLRCSVEHGILQDQCARLMESFFQKRRNSGEVAEPG